MLYKVVVAASLASASAFSASADYAMLFSAWKKEHNKVYDSASAEAKAFAAFAKAEETIAKHNAGKHSYTLGHNEFSDMMPEEFFATMVGYNRTKVTRETFASAVHEHKEGEELAASVDWVAAGAVTPVKNQGSCGSCWAFSTTGSVEGAYQIASGKLVSLSEEDLVQCNSITDSGCQGGLMDNAFKWIETNGIASEADYPYTSGTGITGTCKTSLKNNPVVKVTGYTDVRSGSETSLKSAIAKQPVSVAIEADKSVFQLYKSGVLNSKTCGTNLDHGVLAVGYGTLNGQEYYKVKNSWGKTWGESGYILMAAGVNQCGIALEPSYPTGAKAW